MFDIMGIMGKAQQAKTKLEALRADQVNMRASATAPGGQVTVTVDGNCKVVDLSIDPALIANGDADQVADLVVIATNDAISTVKDQVKARMKAETEGLLPNIPGLDIGGMLG